MRTSALDPFSFSTFFLQGLTHTLVHMNTSQRAWIFQGRCKNAFGGRFLMWLLQSARLTLQRFFIVSASPHPWRRLWHPPPFYHYSILTFFSGGVGGGFPLLSYLRFFGANRRGWSQSVKNGRWRAPPPSCPVNCVRTSGESVRMHLPLSIFTYCSRVVCNACQVVKL